MYYCIKPGVERGKHRPWRHSPLSLEQLTLVLEANHRQTTILHNPAQDQQELILGDQYDFVYPSPIFGPCMFCLSRYSTYSVRTAAVLTEGKATTAQGSPGSMNRLWKTTQLYAGVSLNTSGLFPISPSIPIPSNTTGVTPGVTLVQQSGSGPGKRPLPHPVELPTCPLLLISSLLF